MFVTPLGRRFALRTTLAICLGLFLWLPPQTFAAQTPAGLQVAAASGQKAFDTPEAAVEALLEALKVNDGKVLLDIFGHEHQQLIVLTDKAAARVNRRRAYNAAQEMWRLRDLGDDTMELIIGGEAWPMPIPLIKDGGGWRFDTEAGAEEIINRRIGENELAAIGLCRAYVAAQLDYASQDRDGDEVLEYAQNLGSTQGKKDGLYWAASAGESPSPFGPLVAEAGPYLEGRQKGDPFRGYRYKLLTRQGANPPGGAYDYVINGNMIDGFALLAWPADYGSSGIMTFLVSHQGKVFENDLGDDTEGAANAIDTYDPDDSWILVTD